MLKNKRLKIFISSFTVCALFTAGFTNNAASSVTEVMAAGLLAENTFAKAPVSEQQAISQTAEKAVMLAEAKRKEAEEKAAREAEEKAAREAEEKAAAQNDGDLRLMAAIIFCEAGNQSYEGQVAVGAVVMNRVRSASYPNSIQEVIYQSGQFGPAATGWLDQVLASGSYTESAMQAAKDALAGANPIGECLYFDQGSYGYQIGAHYFH